MIFLDEFGTHRGMTRRYGRATRGKRADGAAPSNPGKNVTLVMGLRLRGIVAPFSFEGAMDGNIWDQYIATQVAPTLRKGDIVVVDGLGAHRTRASRRTVRARGALYWILPGYSPDLNPVENAGSKVKESLRGQEAQTLDGLYDAMGQAIGQIGRRDARGWFRRAGYLPALHRQPRRQRKQALAQHASKDFSSGHLGARAPPCGPPTWRPL